MVIIWSYIMTNTKISNQLPVIVLIVFSNIKGYPHFYYREYYIIIVSLQTVNSHLHCIVFLTVAYVHIYTCSCFSLQSLSSDGAFRHTLQAYVNISLTCHRRARDLKPFTKFTVSEKVFFLLESFVQCLHSMYD